MKRFLVCLLFGVICCNLYAQFLFVGENDLTKRNLKGPVLRVIEKTYAVEEAFGEWKKGTGEMSRYSVFDEDGRCWIDTEEESLFDKKDRWEYVADLGVRLPLIHYAQLNLYGDDGVRRLALAASTSSISYSEALKEKDNIKDWFIDKLPCTIIQFEYETDGSVKSKTYSVKSSNPWDDEPAKYRIGWKEVYKYNDDGFEVWYYNKDGKRDTYYRTYQVINSKRMIIKRDRETSVEVYDEYGHLVERAIGINASNGKLSGSTYYSYNENGDLLAFSASVEGTKSIKGLESLYPIFKEDLSARNIDYYEYTYDSHGNWIVRKQYRIKNDEVIVAGWVEREITYENEGFDWRDVVSEVYGIFNFK